MGNIGTRQAVCSIPCNLCGSTEAERISLADRDGNRLGTIICRVCGLVWTDPRPGEIGTFYKEEYRVLYKGAYLPKPKHIYRAGKVAVARHDRIKAYLDKDMSVLDVGSGGGEFVYLMKTLGCRATGIEPNEGYARHSVSAYGIDVRIGLLQDVSLEGGGYDFVTMWHVLEHVEDPARILEKIVHWIRQGGFLAVEVPDIEATCQSPSNRFHIAHLYNFNLVTLKNMGKKAGLTVVEHVASPDGGNVTVIFRKGGDPGLSDRPDWENNYGKIVGIMRSHTLLRHFTSSHPYARLARKILRVLDEKIATVRFVDGKLLLDRCYSRHATAR